jgi:nitrous oxidase accessory protein
LLKDIRDSHIEENFFTSNTVGIFMEGATRSKFLSNEFRSNGWAVKITGSCDSNEFVHNDFIGNTFDASTNTELNFNEFRENYWSRYTGYDLDHDGFGDVPFRPVRLSSVILDRTDSAFVILNSFLLTVLDEIERVLPGLTPERLKDERPAMKRNLSRGEAVAQHKQRTSQ